MGVAFELWTVDGTEGTGLDEGVAGVGTGVADYGLVAHGGMRLG